MTPANYGSVFSCCLFGSLMMLYLYVFCRSKRFILRNGTFVIYLAVGVVMIRMLLPPDFRRFVLEKARRSCHDPYAFALEFSFCNEC